MCSREGLHGEGIGGGLQILELGAFGSMESPANSGGGIDASGTTFYLSRTCQGNSTTSKERPYWLTQLNERRAARTGTFLLLLLALPAVVARFDSTIKNGTSTITGYTGSGSPVAIPGTINCLPVSDSGSSALRAHLAGRLAVGGFQPADCCRFLVGPEMFPRSKRVEGNRSRLGGPCPLVWNEFLKSTGDGDGVQPPACRSQCGVKQKKSQKPC
jgi:hypothetical protein